jgi:iron complex outermembrane receptor protein
MKKTSIASAVSLALAGGSILSVGAAHAQEVDDREDAQAIEEIVTTGSRIRKDVFTSSTPLSVIDVGEASVQGIANVGELLQANTAAAGSAQVTSAITTETGGLFDGGLGINSISLRGLGASRTLVLLNGRRAGPAGTGGAVSAFDLSVLPLATIQRVEILKDGASSIYGSDAVAGVVNIITRKDDGGSIDGYISSPTESGGANSRLSATYGKSFSRGSFRLTADYNKQEELARGDRDYFECGQQYIFDQATGQRGDAIDPRSGDYRCRDLTWGHIWVYDYGAGNIPGGSFLSQYDYDGDLGQYIDPYGPVVDPADLQTPAGWFPVGYDRQSDGVLNSDHPFQDAQSLVPENELITFYAEGEYSLTEGVELYGELLLNRRTTKYNGYRQYWTYLYSGNWDFANGLCDDGTCGSQLTADAGWFGQQWYSPTAITDHSDSKVEVDYTRFLTGLRGEFGNGWAWDTTVQYSVSDGKYTDDQIYNDSIQDQWFGTGSCVGTVSSVRGAPCVDVRWFSEDVMNGVVTPEERAFLFGVEQGQTDYTQWSVDGFVTGELYELPAGALSMATGFHYRRDEIDDLPGEITLADNAWGSSAAGNTVGKDTTKALFVEFDAPLVADKTGIQNLTLNASARWTDVESYGDDTTWKVGLNWQITDSVRIRANKGTSFRAPALYELYLADQTSFASQRIDPCIRWGENLAAGNISQTVADNCAADQSPIGGPAAGLAPDYTGGTISPGVITGGGIGVLEAETSESLTYGLIWQPRFADISFSADYYEIDVRGEVERLGAGTIVFECYASNFGFAFGATEPLCAQFDRTNVNDGLDNIRDSYLNIAKQLNRGIDYAVRYNTEVGGFGDLSIELKANKQIEDTKALFAETAEDLNGLVGDPEWVGDFSVSLFRGPMEFYYTGRYVGSADSTRDLGRSTVTYRGDTFDAVLSVPSVTYHNLSMAYNWDDQGIRALVGVANIADEAPPQVTTQGTGAVLSTVGNAAFYSQYDWFGRRFFANLTYSFE